MRVLITSEMLMFPKIPPKMAAIKSEIKTFTFNRQRTHRTTTEAMIGFVIKSIIVVSFS